MTLIVGHPVWCLSEVLLFPASLCNMSFDRWAHGYSRNGMSAGLRARVGGGTGESAILMRSTNSHKGSQLFARRSNRDVALSLVISTHSWHFESLLRATSRVLQNSRSPPRSALFLFRCSLLLLRTSGSFAGPRATFLLEGRGKGCNFNIIKQLNWFQSR